MPAQTLEALYRELKSGPRGLTSEEVAARLEELGRNVIERRKGKSWLRSFLEEFTDLMVVILMGAAMIAMLSGELRDGGVILFIVVLNATIGFFQKYKAEKALEALRNMLSPHAKVLRNGKVMEVAASTLVPGDVFLIGEGDKIPADAQLIEGNELEVDESSLTGESVPVKKECAVTETKKGPQEPTHLVFMGTGATHGTAKAIVVATGMNTSFGKIAQLTQTTQKDKSPLQKELFKIGAFAGKITIVISLALFGVVTLFQEKSFTETLLFATSVAVAAVPEGLPATITIALAIGVQRLAKKKSIVKKLASVETLGSTTVICSDKTGTLTKNEMTVVTSFMDSTEVSLEGIGYSPQGKWEFKTQSPAFEKLCETALLCNNSKLYSEKKKWSIIGDPTEGALIVACEKGGHSSISVLKKFKRIHELPFDSTRKMMTTVDQEKNTGKITAHLKGAPDEVLKICSHIYEAGKIIKMTPQKRKNIQTMNEAMANRALRVLAFAQRPLASNEKIKEKIEKNMIFIGMMGMIDPPRPEVYQAVQLAHKAGIKIYMVTGDYGPTAVAIGKNLNIVQGNNVKVLSGNELSKVTEANLRKLFKDKKQQLLFARVSPEHKLKIVKALKDNGEVVAMTGDGVNDAPALKRADIGVAMGITGTDVSKEAADMVLVDDSFGTIVTAIEEGRTIYDNLKKFVFYMFSCNMGELITIVGAIALGLPNPLSAILILTVNLGTDVLPALALGVDPGSKDIMERKPRSGKKHILEKKFVAHFIYLGFLMGILVLTAYIVVLKTYGWKWGMDLEENSFTYLKATTSAFVLLVIVQMVNAFNVRELRQSILRSGLFKNHWLLGATCLSILAVAAFVEIPFFQRILGTTHLTLREWGFLGAASLLLIGVEEARKCINPSSNPIAS